MCLLVLYIYSLQVVTQPVKLAQREQCIRQQSTLAMAFCIRLKNKLLQKKWFATQSDSLFIV